MAMNGRGRTGFGSGLGSTQYSYFGSQSGSGRTGMSSKRGSKKSGCGMTTPVGYKNCCTMFQTKIQSFKMLQNQTMGPAKAARPSPSTLNTFANWVNKGAIIQTVSPMQVAKWARATRKNFNTRSATPTACKTVLCAKFGKSTIKAVARGKSGTFLVATTATQKGRPFCFPK